jgi:hypothetical protein
MQALGLQLMPSHFVAFMPQELEDRLAQLELSHMSRKEEQIDSTWFRAVPTRGGGYNLIVVSQSAK